MSFSVMIGQLLYGLSQTVLIFVLTLLFSLPLGILIYFAETSRLRVLRGVTRVFISIMRGTPLMLQLFLWYYAPFYLFHANIAGYKFTAVIIGFSLNYAAYFAEIYRSGIESIPVGQTEAGRILGYSEAQSFIYIIMPQMIKRVLPAITNEVITLVKDTSLVYSINYIEMFALAKQIAAAGANVMPLVVAGVFYYVFNAIVAKVMALIEKKYSYYR